MKRYKSGEQATNKSIKNRSLEDHITGEAKIVEEGAADAPVENIGWDAKQVEVESDVKLTDDAGFGKALVIRTFDFGANPEAFLKHTPSAQELFNSHLRDLEIALSTDGLKMMTDVVPRVKVSKNKKFYRITVGAEPMKGHRLLESPQTLTQLANDPSRNTHKLH